MFVGLSVSCMWGCPFGILLESSVIVRTTKTGAPHIPQPFRDTLHTPPTRTCLGFTNSPHIPQPSRGTLYQFPSHGALRGMPCLGVIVLPLTSPSHSVKHSLTQPTQTCRVLSDLPALLLAPHTHSVTHSLISVNSYMSSFVGFFTILETTSGRNTNDSCTVTAIPVLS